MSRLGSLCLVVLSIAGVGEANRVWAQAPKPLRVVCEADYSIYFWRKEFQPDPELIYTTPGESLGGRFRIKLLAANRLAPADTLHIVVSYWDGQQYSVLQQITYDPGHLNASRQAGGVLTGEQRVYSPDLGRQLRYECRLSPEAL